MPNTLDDHSAAKERLSFDKVKSTMSLLLGKRARDFQALLPRVPTSTELTAVAQHLGIETIENVIFDVDGTLVSPYANMNPGVLDTVRTFHDDNRSTAVYTNSPHSDRLQHLRDIGMKIATTGMAKPSQEGFEILCDQCEMEPSKTAMIGNFAITDMPLRRRGTAPLFPLNILVESIPPQRELLTSSKQYMRASIFHTLCVAAAWVVRCRNPHILRDIPAEDHS